MTIKQKLYMHCVKIRCLFFPKHVAYAHIRGLHNTSTPNTYSFGARR